MLIFLNRLHTDIVIVVNWFIAKMYEISINRRYTTDVREKSNRVDDKHLTNQRVHRMVVVTRNVHRPNLTVYLRERDSPLSPRTEFYKNVNHHTRKFRNGVRRVRGGGIEIQVSNTTTIGNRARRTIVPLTGPVDARDGRTIFYREKNNGIRNGTSCVLVHGTRIRYPYVSISGPRK